MKPEDQITAGSTPTSPLTSLVDKMGKKALTIVVVTIACTVVVFVMWVVNFLNIVRLEDTALDYTIAYMKDFTFAEKFDDRIKIILIGEKATDGPFPSGDIDRKHREYFAKLIDAMADAGARIVALDASLEHASDFDAQIGQAIARAKDKKLRVIMGVDEYVPGKGTDPVLEPAFGDPLWGTILIAGHRGSDKAVTSLKLADFNEIGTGDKDPVIVPSLALRSVMELYEPALYPEFDDSRANLLLYKSGPGSQLFKSIPLIRQEALLIEHPSQIELENVRIPVERFHGEIGDPKAMAKYKDTIVLVGYEFGDRVDLMTGEKRLGIELHATAISNILNDIFIYPLGPLQNFLIIFLMCALAATLHTRVGSYLKIGVEFTIPMTNTKVPIPISLIIIIAVYLTIAFLAYKTSRIYLEVCYHLAAAVITYGVLAFIFREPPEPAAPPLPPTAFDKL